MLNYKGEEVGIIYGWYCTVTDKWYIGQTVNPEGRFNCHIDRAINKKDKTYFYNSIRKYGLENFVYCVLEENVLRENLNMREMDWIEYYDSFYCGYNMTAGGNQTIFSEEFKRKISESHKGLIGEKNPFHGKHHSEETRKKLSESHKGKPGYWTNKHLSEETKKKLSESHKGDHGYWTNKHLPEEIRKRISESHKGKTSPNRKKVSQYDLNGNYIQTFNSLKEAQEKTNIAKSSICTVCKGLRKQAGGFIWKYAS